jgi:hypothetical protein
VNIIPICLLISHAEGRTQIEGVWEQGAEEKYLDLRGRKWREAGEDCIMKSFITFTLHQILLGWSHQG